MLGIQEPTAKERDGFKASSTSSLKLLTAHTAHPMLRACLPVSRQLAHRPIVSHLGAQWQRSCPSQDGLRSFGDVKAPATKNKASIGDSNTVLLPGTSSNSAPAAQPLPPGSVSPATPAKSSSDTAVPPESIPRLPPTPAEGQNQTAPPSSISPRTSSRPRNPPSSNAPTPPHIDPLPPPPPSRRKGGRFRRFLFTLLVLGCLSYAGGVYYSFVSDNFHDFFTEYVPFGEDAVAYFEEQEFRKRFPNASNPTNRPAVDDCNKVTIPSQSGVSWRVADEERQGSDPSTKDKPMSLSAKNEHDAKTGQQQPAQATGGEKTKAVESVKRDAPASMSAKGEPPISATEVAAAPAALKPVEKPAPTAEKAQNNPFHPPEVNDPSRIMPIEPLDPLKIQNADEPVVQDLVKILNDIITVVNSDGASHKYSSTIDKAKSALTSVGRDIISIKTSEQQAANAEIQKMQSQFDDGARELVRRLEGEMHEQENQWRDAFDSEREKLARSYNERISAEMKRAQEVMVQRLRNELLEQAITLKKQFLEEVTNCVETERDGRLSKLSDLHSSVSELEELTAEWNAVVDVNLRTQHLQVAVEAVRSSLEGADRPRPFVKELAALKEIAADDSVINAAIASINPSAYQSGIPSTPQLIDRFRRVAAEVRKASLLPEDAGVASHAASFMLSRFLFKKKGMTVGDDVESVLTRTETLLEEGRLDDAAREMNTLEGWAKTLSWDWLSECRRVLEVRQAMDVIATEARLEGLKGDA